MNSSFDLTMLPETNKDILHKAIKAQEFDLLVKIESLTSTDQELKEIVFPGWITTKRLSYSGKGEDIKPASSETEFKNILNNFMDTAETELLSILNNEKNK